MVTGPAVSSLKVFSTTFMIIYFVSNDLLNHAALVLWNKWHAFFTLFCVSRRLKFLRSKSKTHSVILKLFFMLRWTIIFLVVALIAALLGFTGIASGAAAIAKIFFYIFIVLFLISLIAGGFRGS